MNHEWVRVSTEIGNDRWHALRYQSRGEGNVTGKPIEFGYDDRAYLPPSQGEGFRKLRPAIECIGAVAGDPRDPPIAIQPEPDRIAVRPGFSAGTRSAKTRCAW